MIRRTVAFLVALALTAGGGFVVVFLLFFAHSFKIWMLAGSGFVLLIGLYWIWADYIHADPRPE